MKNSQSFLKLPFHFDIEKLLLDLKCVEQEDWVEHPNKDAYSGSWLVSSLTSVDGDTRSTVAMENQVYKDTPLMKKTQYIKKILAIFQTTIEAVRFMKLSSSSSIKEHCDKGSSFEEGYARLHIPISTNPNVEFILSGQRYKMDIGHCYYIDAHNPHSVVNNGESDRVHLLIDCQVNEWFKSIFLKEGFKKVDHKYGNKSLTDDNIDEVIESLKIIGTPTALKIAEELEKKKVSNLPNRRIN